MVDPLFGLFPVDCWRVIISREAERSSDGCDNIRNLDLDLNNIAVDARCMTQFCTDKKNYKYNDSVAMMTLHGVESVVMVWLEVDGGWRVMVMGGRERREKRRGAGR